MTANSTGNCYLCGASLSKSAMRNHLFKLHGEDKGGQECSLLKIEGLYQKDYWLYIDIPKKETLDELDYFLRQIWLECCGHMSAFLYPKHIEIDMNRRLESFAAGDKFLHHYDFGTTTETAITIMGTTIRKKQKDSVRLLARNVPPVFQCKDCGKQADFIYMGADDNWEMPFYCAKCGKKYDDMLLPISNSPRMGSCGYSGENDTFTFDPKSITQQQAAVIPQSEKPSRRGAKI
jgi:transcription elongation factor Elf1